MPLPINALYSLARDALDAVVNHWDVDAVPLPERQFVSNGLVVWDCEQVAVAIERTFGTDADAASEAMITGSMDLVAVRAAQIAVWVLRCVPDMTEADDGEVVVPSAGAIEASAQTLLSDSVAAFNALCVAVRADELGTCSGIAFEGWNIDGPQGGMGGGVLRVRALLL